MACCIFAAMLIAHLISLWQGMGERLRKIPYWFTGQPRKVVSSELPQPSALKPLFKRIGPRVALVLGIEVIAVLGFGWHHLSSGHDHHSNQDNPGTHVH